MRKEINRECQKYQELQDVNLALDLVIVEGGGEEKVIYEVTEEFWDDTHETETFRKFAAAESYFDKYVEMVG